MRIVLTKYANLENGGYSWMLNEGTTQCDVTGLILEAFHINNTSEIQTLTLEGFEYVLAPCDVLVEGTELSAKGYGGFDALIAYSFRVKEFSTIEG